MKYFACFALTLSISQCVNDQLRTKHELEGKLMPPFDLLLLDSLTYLNTNTINPKSSVVFFYLNPDCPFCRAQTNDIIDNINMLSNIRFYFIGNTTITLLKKYEDKYKLSKFRNITVAQDYTNFFQKYFNIPGVPCTTVYNHDKILKHVLIGKVSSKIIKQASED